MNELSGNGRGGDRGMSSCVMGERWWEILES
jgi:hypothetical protein